MSINASELILNEDGSVYHLHLLPEQIANTIITVGDPDRVAHVSKHFDRIEHRVQKREFITHTGYIGNLRLSVISTGIGTDNIDIVMNELDALVNIDFHTRQVKDQLTSLNFIRVGTSGCMRNEIPIDSFLVSNMGVGMDGLLNYYKRDLSAREAALDTALMACFQEAGLDVGVRPQVADGSDFLVKAFSLPGWYHGITVSATGFYAPQNRTLRAQPAVAQLFDAFENFNFQGLQVTNLEMETAAIFGLGNMLGHRSVSLNALLANRRAGIFSKQPERLVENLIKQTLDKLSSLDL